MIGEVPDLIFDLSEASPAVGLIPIFRHIQSHVHTAFHILDILLQLGEVDKANDSGDSYAYCEDGSEDSEAFEL